MVNTTASAFSVSIIPHTLGETVLAHKRPGDSVNLECDVLGKYVDHLLHYKGAGGESEEGSSRISHDFLAANGFV
ncbi:Riboflavin synthase [compost metagenome]